MMKNITALSLLALLLTGCARATPSTPALWKVSDADNSLYLLGSFHFLKPGDYPLSNKIEAAMQDAEYLLFELAPQEMQSRKPPYWQVEFEGWNRPTLYLSPQTGELISRRHALWRVFDVAWMLHIMDYDERTDVNNPLLRVATWSAFAMALTGAWLLIWSFPRRKRKKA